VELAGKVALVTGAGSGIGRAIALRLAAEGASVGVDDVAVRAGRETARTIVSAGGSAAFVRGDVASAEDTRAIVAFAKKTFGGLDVLVNNAGCAFRASFPKAGVRSWSRVLDVYLRGTMLCTHEAVRAMTRGGAIVNIASGAGVGLRPHNAPEYAAAKAGVIRLTATLAGLRQERNIRVNCICPGWVDTPASRKTIAAMTPAERRANVPAVLLAPEEIADAVVRLIEDEALAGRVMLCYEGQPRRLLPIEKES
jgi:NAD(P)-dependent dehydrogenase (short-subunit alcohol dehydrogenase family)